MAAITTTGTLTAGNSRTFALAPGSALTLTLLPNCRVTVTETPETVSASDAGGNSPRTHNHQFAGVFTYGPYVMGGSVVVDNASNSGSTVTWVRSDALVAESASGVVSLVDGAGNVVSVAPSDETPVLVIGGDHPYGQWGTADSPGMGKAYLDHGITPYMAINTFTGGGASPGYETNLTYAQIAALKESGVEVVSHGYSHIQAWGRQNTGVQIRYAGANATATVHIQTSGADTVLTLTDSGATPLTLTTKTLTEAKALVDAVAGWSMTIAGELTGSESAAHMLRLSAARTIKTGGAEVLASTYFSCGGGVQIEYTGSAYAHVWMRRRESGTFEMYGDGLRLASLDLTLAAQDTLAEFVAVINAISGFTCKLFDNDKAALAGARNYLLGDELTINLVECRYAEVCTRPGILQAGLPLWYMTERQFVAAKETAAANGVVLQDYAQSGGEIYPWTLNGHNSYGFHRIESWKRTIAPKPMPLAVPVNWMPHKNTAPRDDATQPYSRAAVLAMIDALCASPGWCQNVLIHAVVPDGSGVSQYPALALSAGDMDMYADDWFAMLAHIKSKVDAGQLEVWTHKQMRERRMKKAPPRNLLFNPTFQNAGGSLVVSSVNSGVLVPGWAVMANNSHANSCAITDGTFRIDSSNLGLVSVLQSEVVLTPGKTYEIGVMVEYESVHGTSSNSGFRIQLQPKKGAFFGMNSSVLSVREGVAVATSSAVQCRAAHSTLRFTVPHYRGATPATVVGSATLTTLDLTTNKNVKIQIDGKTALDNIDCSAGAASASAVTPSEIANAINNALAASSTYGHEYRNVASAVSGKIVLTAPYTGRATDAVEGYTLVPSAATTTSAFTGIFGSGPFLGLATNQVTPEAGLNVFNLILSVGFGITRITRPYVCEVVQTS